MAKLTLSDVVSGYASATAVNANNTLVENALENTLSRDGTSPNAMMANLDMNNYRILNLPSPVSVNEPARLQDVLDASSTNDANFVVYTPAGTGAVDTTVRAKLREGVSVKDFGAVGDGVTDDYAAFQAAHDSLSASNSDVGGEIYIPSGTYYLSDTWDIKKRVTIRGTNAGDQPETSACILRFPANKDGIRFWSSIDSDTGTNAVQSRLIGVELKANAKDATGNGIKTTTKITVEHCIIRDFKENGIEIHGQTGGGATGIADFWKVSSTRIVTCGGHGLYVHGNDSQIGLAEQVECSSNTGYGFYDISAYGNTYIACQAAGNTAGSYYNVSTTTYYGSIYLGCYVEFGTGATPVFNSDSIILGGVLSAVAETASGITQRSPGGFGPNVPTGGAHMWFRNLVEIARIGTDNILSGLAGFKSNADTDDYTLIDGNSLTQVSSSSASQTRVNFDTPSGRVLNINSNGTDITFKNQVGDIYFAPDNVNLVQLSSNGFGYTSGVGGTVTQATDKSTGVTLNKVCGQITMNGATLNSATGVNFTLTNSTIAATDVVIANISSGATVGGYLLTVSAVSAGSCSFSLRNVSGGALSEAVVISFSVIKGATS